MIKKLVCLLHADALKVFLSLWFQDASLSDLSQKTGIPPERLEALLHTLTLQGLMTPLPLGDESFWQIEPSFRAKLSKTLFPLMVTVALSFLGFVIGFGDKTFRGRQKKRLSRQMRSLQKR